jgi:methionyl-tRNA formyltransferase
LINTSTLQDPDLSPGLPLDPGAARLHKTRGLQIRCKEGTVLEVTRLKQEGKRKMGAKDWWNGVKGLGVVKGSVAMFRSIK